MAYVSLPPLSLELEFARAEQAGDPFSFRFAPQEYLFRSAGGGFQSASFSWDAALLSDLAAARQPGSSPVILQRIGETLHRFLSALGWEEQERQILQANREGQEVLLTIRSAAAELYALPWELLTLKASGQHVGELPNVLLRYEWPETRTAPEHAVPRPPFGRILFAWSAAGGAVPASEHGAAIAAACRDSHYPFSPQSDILPHASIGRLSQLLEGAAQAKSPIAVLHLLCHGGPVGDTFGLVLDGDNGSGSVTVDAARLRQILAPHAGMVRLLVLSACDSSNSGTLGNHLGSVAQVLHRSGFAAVVASRHPLSVSGSITLAQGLYKELLWGSTSLERALRSTRARLLQEGAHTDWMGVQLYARTADGQDSRPLLFRPFRGLLSFQPEHCGFFFGREREIAEIMSDLQALTSASKPRLLMVAGASGSGKSSVVLAGVVPKLIEASGGSLQLLRMRPGSEPVASLATALSMKSSASASHLLVVDQFEEIFTHVTDPALRQSFVNQLWKLASDPQSGVSILITMRIDFLGRCGELVLSDTGARFDRIVFDEAHRVLIAQMNQPQLQSAILEPVRKVGLEFEEGLPLQLLSEVGSEPGALPLLEDTLDLLWQRRQARLLTQAAYAELGGLSGALKLRADALIDGMSEPEQRMARRLLVRLVSMGQDPAMGTRRRVARSKLCPMDSQDAAGFERVLTKLVEARLLVTDQDNAEQMVEVAHEALIRKWLRLHEWVRAAGDRLKALEEFEGWVKQWRAHETLLIGEQLVHAEQVARRCAEDMEPDARTLLENSRERFRRRRRSSLVLLGLGCLLIPLLAISMISNLFVQVEPFAALLGILLLGVLVSIPLLAYTVFLSLRRGFRAISAMMRRGPAGNGRV